MSDAATTGQPPATSTLTRDELPPWVTVAGTDDGAVVTLNFAGGSGGSGTPAGQRESTNPAESRQMAMDDHAEFCDDECRSNAAFNRAYYGTR